MYRRDEAKLLKSNYKIWKNEKIKNGNGFFPIWNEFKKFLSTSKLSGGALRLYIFFGIVSKNETGESWYSVKRLAEELECSERSIQEWSKELSDVGLIKRFQIKFNSTSFTYLLPYYNETNTKDKKS